MEQNSSSASACVFTPLGVRRAIGAIGFLLPFVLAFGKMLGDGPGIESSISTYYHTCMRDVFVGAMCAIGVLFFAYKGYDSRDGIAAKLAALFAIGLALVPTAPDFSRIPGEIASGNLHLGLAAAFFLVLAYFSLFLFTRTDSASRPTRQKLQRNRIYRICGAVIATALILIVIVKQFAQQSWLLQSDVMFWLESIAVAAFGISWLVKGEIVIRDAREFAVEKFVTRHE